MSDSLALPAGVTLAPLTGMKNTPPCETPQKQKGGKSHARGSHGGSRRYATINAFVDAHMGDLPRAAALAWITLWRFERDGVCRVSITKIAACLGCSKRQALRGMAELEDRKLVEVAYRGRINAGVSVYRLTPATVLTGDTHVTSTGDI